MIKLLETQVLELIRLPEQGMGYQMVETEYRSSTRRGTVFNAELLVWDQDSRTIPKQSYETLLRSADATEAQFIRSFRVLPRASVVAESLTRRYGETSAGKPATDGQPMTTLNGEIFARFTAYETDRRITSDRGLVAGTYATTAADADRVSTGSHAVERYALPDPAPAIYRFTIIPRYNTRYRKGVVQPAFGHAGGGIEVLFDDATGPNTVRGPRILPP